MIFDEWYDEHFPEGCEALNYPFLKRFCMDSWNAALQSAQQPQGAICQHWEKFNSECPGEFGVCKCAGKPLAITAA